MTQPRFTPYEDDHDDWLEQPEVAAPPVRRRRRVTPATVILAAVLIAAVGFIAGVEVQKHQGGDGALQAGQSTSFPGAPGGGPAGAGGAGGGGRASRGAPAGVTFGEVANKNEKTLYVTDSSGATVRVRLPGSAKITRTATSSAKRVRPGDTVVVQGTAGFDGTITATQVTASESGTSALPGGGFPGAGGQGGPTGGAAGGQPGGAGAAPGG